MHPSPVLVPPQSRMEVRCRLLRPKHRTLPVSAAETQIVPVDSFLKLTEEDVNHAETSWDLEWRALEAEQR